MKYRRLDANGDYTFGQNKYNFLTDIEAVAQSIKTRMLLFYSEWWEDLESGIPMFQQILSTRMSDDNKNAIDQLVKERILTTEHVTQLVDFTSSFERNTGTYSVITSVETEYGVIANLSVEV